MAAALAGSLATYLFAPARTTPASSVGVAYQSAGPTAVQRGARVVGPGGNARVQVPAGASGSVSVLPPKRIAAGRVQVVLPPGNAGGPAARQIVVGPGGSWVGAPMPGCAVAGPGGLPPGRRMSISIARPGALKRIVYIRGRRASVSWVQVPAPQVVIVRPPAAKRILIGPGRGARRVYVVGPAGRPTVIVGPGWRSVRAPRQVYFSRRPGKRLSMIHGGVLGPVPWSGPACVFVGPSR